MACLCSEGHSSPPARSEEASGCTAWPEGPVTGTSRPCWVDPTNGTSGGRDPTPGGGHSGPLATSLVRITGDGVSSTSDAVVASTGVARREPEPRS